MMKKEIRINRRPIMANVSVCFAPSACFGSPFEVTHLYPANIIKTSAVTPARPSAQLMRFWKTSGIHESVATCPPGTVAKHELQSIE